MSEIVDITVGIIQEEITISAVNNIGEITVNAVSNSEEVNVTANTNLIQINISTAPVTIINPQDYDLSQFTNTSSNPFVQQSGLTSYVPISRTITINGISQDLSTDRSWTIPAATWGSITGTLALQTDLQAALDAKVPTSRTLTINGTSYDLSADRSWTISTGITIGSTAITSGTVGRVLFEGTGNVVQESANLFWDNTNGRLGVGTSSPAYPMDIRSNTQGTVLAIRNNGSSGQGNSTAQLFLSNVDGYTSQLTLSNSGILLATHGNNSTFSINGYLSVGSLFRVVSTGNVLINTTTDAGFKLDVNGTARVQGATEITHSGATMLTMNRTAGISAALFITNIRVGGGQGLVLSAPGFSFANGASKYLTSDGGRVGITTNDDALLASLHVKGLGSTSSTRNVLFRNSSNTDLFTIWDDGAIGVNTSTNAGFKLDVNGTARVDQTLRLNGTGTGELINFGGNVGRFTIDGLFIRFKVSGGGDILNMTTNFFGVNETAVIPSAICAMTSTNRGFLPPRMTTTQKNAIASPATGLQIFDTTLNRPCFYDGTTWITL